MNWINRGKIIFASRLIDLGLVCLFDLFDLRLARYAGMNSHLELCRGTMRRALTPTNDALSYPNDASLSPYKSMVEKYEI